MRVREPMVNCNHRILVFSCEQPPLSLILSTVSFSHFAHFFSISSLTLCSPTEAPLPEAILLIHGNMHEIIFSGPTPVLVSDKICILCKVNFIVCEPSAFAINANPTKQIENRVYVSPQLSLSFPLSPQGLKWVPEAEVRKMVVSEQAAGIHSLCTRTLSLCIHTVCTYTHTHTESLPLSLPIYMYLYIYIYIHT